MTPLVPPSPARLNRFNLMPVQVPAQHVARYLREQKAKVYPTNQGQDTPLASLSHLPRPASYDTPDCLPGTHFADTLNRVDGVTPDALAKLAQKRANFLWMLDQVRNEAGYDSGPAWQGKEGMSLDVRVSVNLARKLSRTLEDEKPFHLPTDKHGRKLWNLDFLSSQAKHVIEFRNCCLFPAVAKARRAGPRRLLEWYFAKMEVENDARKYGQRHRARMIVFNAGQTVPVELVGARIKEVCNKVSDAFERTTAAGFPVVPLCRNVEIAGFWDEEKNCLKWSLCEGKKRILYHVHSHVLVVQTEKMTRQRWGEFLVSIGAKDAEASEEIVSEAKQKGGKAWEAGLLASPAEATKYVTKVKGLELLPNEELAALFRQTFRRKMLHLLGPALAQSKAWKEAKETLAPPRNGRDAEVGPSKVGADPTDKSKAPDRPQVLSVTRPHCIFGRYARPSLLVRCKECDLERCLAEWLESPVGQRVQFLTVAAMHARDALAPALDAFPPEAGRAFSSHYGDSFQSRTGNAPPPRPQGPPPDPAEVNLQAVFPEFYD